MLDQSRYTGARREIYNRVGWREFEYHFSCTSSQIVRTLRSSKSCIDCF